MRGHNTVEQNLMPDSWLILSPVAAPACGVHKNCKITFTPDGGAINVAKRGNKSESLPLVSSMNFFLKCVDCSLFVTNVTCMQIYLFNMFWSEQKVDLSESTQCSSGLLNFPTYLTQ